MTDTATIEPLLVDVDTARHVLGGVGRTTLYRLERAGAIEAVHIGRARRYTLASIATYVRSLSSATPRTAV